MTARRPLLPALVPGLAAALAVAVFAAAAAAGKSEVLAFEYAAGVVAALGAAAVLLSLRPAWTISVGLALAMFNSHWATMGIGIPVDRIVLTVGVVSTVLREWSVSRDSLRTRPIDWLLGATVLYALVSAIIVGTIGRHDAQFALLDRFGVVPFLLFFVAPVAFREERDRRVLLGVLFAMGAYLGVTAVLESVHARALIFPRYITDPTVGIHYGRARGPFAEAAGNGLVLYGCGVAAAVAFVTWRGRTARGFAVAIMLLCALGTLLTLTRAAWLSAIVATVVTLLFARETRRLVVPALVAGTATVLLAFAVIPGLEHRAISREKNQYPLWDRRNSNAAALRMVAARPLVGFGWGKYSESSLPYYRQSQDYPLTIISNVHNVYLANATELGIIGAALWLVSLLLAVGRGVLRRGPPELRPWRVGLLALWVSYAVVAFTTPLGFALPTMLLWAWAGVTWSDIRRSGAWAAVPRSV